MIPCPKDPVKKYQTLPKRGRRGAGTRRLHWKLPFGDLFRTLAVTEATTCRTANFGVIHGPGEDFQGSVQRGPRTALACTKHRHTAVPVAILGPRFGRVVHDLQGGRLPEPWSFHANYQMLLSHAVRCMEQALILSWLFGADEHRRQRIHYQLFTWQ